MMVIVRQHELSRQCEHHSLGTMAKNFYYFSDAMQTSFSWQWKKPSPTISHEQQCSIVLWANQLCPIYNDDRPTALDTGSVCVKKTKLNWV